MSDYVYEYREVKWHLPKLSDCWMGLGYGSMGQRPMQALRRRVAVACLAIWLGDPVLAEGLSVYGTPGLIEMPVATALPDGQFAVTTAAFGATFRNTLSFQIMPRVLGTFRYSVLEDLFGPGETLYDRSFDLHLTLLRETENRPALSFGLRDFGGTGVYSSEYLVASKTLLPGLSVTAGLGWGRLGERNSFANPLVRVSDSFGNRPSAFEGGIATTGQLDADAWLRGDVALFGGVAWQVNDQLSILAEYSSDPYTLETERGLITQTTPFNFGLRYGFSSGVVLGAYYMYGSEIGAALSFALDPKTPPAPGGLASAPPPLVARDLVAKSDLVQTLNGGLDQQGLVLRGVTVDGARAQVLVENDTWPEPAQAAGRAARVLVNSLPAGVEEVAVTFVDNGVTLATVMLSRADLESLEHDLDGAWLSLSRAHITGDPVVPSQIIGPRLSFGLGPYLDFSFFDPDNPIRADVGLEFSARYSPRPGVIFGGRISQPLFGNLGYATRVSNSVLPHVRSDAALYRTGTAPELSELTGAYFFRPGKDVFGRVTVGYLESMFGGVSGELLWRPIEGRFAIGADLNHVWQRDYDHGFGFQDYEVTTGHVSAYQAFANGFEGQIDVGRYLAGDYGATFRLDRRFNNGFRVGAFFTLTDVSFEDFGEGSFDKGIVIEVPLSWLRGRATQDTIRQVVRPVLRDGGAQLAVSDRLYEMTRDYRASDMEDSWGTFWR